MTWGHDESQQLAIAGFLAYTSSDTRILEQPCRNGLEEIKKMGSI